MAATYNTDTNKITLPIGDTFTFSVNVNGGPFVDGDIALFAVSTLDGYDIIRKPFTLENGKCIVRLNSEDTADKEKGIYTWNIRLLHGASIDGDKIEIDNSDEVMTIWNKPPKFDLVDGGCDV